MARAPFRAVLFLGGLIFLSRNAGEMTHQLERMFGLLCFAVYCLTYIEHSTYAKNAASLLVGALAFPAGIAALTVEPSVAVAGVALATAGLWFLVKGSGVESEDVPVYAFTALAFFAMLLLGKTVPAAWYFGRWLAAVACAIANLASGSAIDFRPTYAGLSITALVLLYWIARWTFTQRWRMQGLLVPMAFTLLAQILYLVAAAWALSVLLPAINATAGRPPEQMRWHQVLLARHVPWNFPLVLFFMNVFVLFGAAGYGEQPQESPPASRRDGLKAMLAAAAFAGFLAVVCFLPPGKLQPQAKPIVFYEKGFLNWETPKWGEYGPLSVGMFGNLPRFVETLGLTSRRTPDITSASLADASAVVIINLDHELPATSTAAVWQFVRGGGTLLLLGDHTAYDEKTKRVYVNEFLAPTSITLNFDAAICPVGGWLHCYDYQRHALTMGLGDQNNEAGIVTGASLRIHPPAYPIVLGRHGYEDFGSRFRPDMAFLGNMMFDANEPLGDTVLAAARTLGRGKVLVFGDTSGFVNGILPGTYDFIGRVFRWIATPVAGVVGQTIIAVVSALLLAVAAGLLLWRRHAGPWSFLVLAVLAVAVPAATERDWLEVNRRDPSGEIAYLDLYHMPFASEEGWRDDGMMGLQMNLMRGGLLAFNLRHFDFPTIRKARVLTIIAPARRFTNAELDMVRTYLERGGVVILSVGWEESYGSQPLLSEFGIELDKDLPLGYFRTDSPVLGCEAMFWKGWCVRDRSNQAQVISAHGEYPVVLVKNVGNGKLAVIGDSDFLLNKNLESENATNQTNINYLKALVAMLLAKGEK